MRGVVYRGPHHVEVVPDLPEPGPARGRDAVVRVTRAAICGTDLHPYRGELPGFGAGTVLGHEFVGVIVDAGADVPLAPGERVLASDIVACGRCSRCTRGWHYQCPDVSLFGYSDVVGRPLAGAQADYVRVPFADVVLSRCPDDLDDEHVLFAGDVLTTGFAATIEAGIVPGDAVAVIGAGAVGVLAALCARLAGAAHVVVADGHAGRRAAAAALGLTAVAPGELAAALAERTEGQGARAVIEAVGSDAALARAIDVAGVRATIVAVGAHHSAAMPFPTATAFARELTIRFAVGDPIRWRDQVIALVRSGRLDPTAIVSHRLSLDDAREGYDLFDRGEATKVVLVADQ